MGICRAGRYKRRLTGGKRKIHKKKRKYELGRPPANTKLGPTRVHVVRGRGRNYKYRAIKLDSGSFSWLSFGFSRVTRIIDVVYNASNNELVRTKTLVKNCIVVIDAHPFTTWYENTFGISLGKKKKEGKEGKEGKEEEGKGKDSKQQKNENETKEDAGAEESKENEKSYQVIKSLGKKTVDPLLIEQFKQGRVLACISSRPGQSGRADGYILEGEELVFYKRRMDKKKRN